MIVVAIDIGGTFTDLIGFDDEAGRFVEAKSLTTPQSSGRAFSTASARVDFRPPRSTS